jgi:uncharacterized protein with HEPN domain
MIGQQIKNTILDHLKDYQPISVGIFGSFARGENTENSDIDILVKFKVVPTLLTLIRIENELSEILGRKVDLITIGAIKNRKIENSIQKDDLTYIEHILDCIRKIKEFSEGLSFKEFSKNELVQDAIIRNIEVIGEVSKKISTDTKQVNLDIPWKEIAGMRDKLIHDYLGVDNEVVWKTIQEDVPMLERQIKKFIEL